MASQPGPAMEFLGRIAYELHLMRPLLPTYFHLLVSAIFPIYIAAHASLSRPPSAAPRKSPKNASQDQEEDSEEESQKIESLTPSDAILFPLLAGGTLASLYFILKWLQDPAWLNWILGLYFSQIGLFFAMKFLKDMFSVTRSYLLPTEYSNGGSLWKADAERRCFRSNEGLTTNAPLPGFLQRLPLPTFVSRRIWTVRSFLYKKSRLHVHLHGILTLKTSLELLDLASLILSCIIVYYHTFVSKPWFLTNFLGFSFCYGSLQFMTPTTGWTGTLVLSALFFYDIYFVFFTPMMVTVATKLDVPIKLLFPRPDGCVYPAGAPEGSEAMEEYLRCLAKKRTMAMLGLGDIVVPGMMLAFALRFDLYLYYLRKGNQHTPSAQEVKNQEKQKPFYSNARGHWGERFWTSTKLWSEDLKARRFPKTYFYAGVCGYLAGMVVTLVVMQVAAHAQPALLYLVPGVLISLWGTALIRGEFKLLWQYSELPEEQEKKKDDKKDEDSKQDNRSKKLTGSGSVNADEAKEERFDKAQAREETQHSSKYVLRKREDEKMCRRLVYFSLAFPRWPDNLRAKAITEGKSTDPVADDTDKPQVKPSKTNGNGAALSARNEDRGDDGEPPEKRARRA